MSGGEMAEEEIEYESDPEQAKLSLKMRRREASDDEDEEGEKTGEKHSTRIDDSEGGSEGAAAQYEDELEEEEEDYDLDEEYVENLESVVVVEMAEASKDGDVTRDLEEEKKDVNNDASEVNDENCNVEDGQGEEEKKEIEPFSVPTAGAFYMHDDRFRDNSGARNRRTLGGRKLWESKDERKWGHDKFEELSVQNRNYDEHRRGSRGRNRGRDRNRGADRGYARVNRPSEYGSENTQNNNNQNNAPKGVRGRGPRRYQPSFKSNSEAPLTQNKQYGKSIEKPSYVSSGRTSDSVSNAEPVVLPQKQVFASSLNIASPPFYPSNNNNVTNKRNVQSGSINQNSQPSVVGESSAIAQSSGMLRGKNKVDSIGLDKLSIDDSLSAKSGSSSINSTPQQLRGQGRGISPSTRMAYQPSVSNKINRVPPPNQLQRNPGQSRPQSFSGQQFMQRGSQAMSPPKATGGALNAFESGEVESPSELSQSKTALVAQGKGDGQVSGRGSFLYGGAQVMGTSGNMGSGRGDSNFPAFLPVMQFGGQHPGGMGVPAVGMAFPGYVGRPQSGLGNSEMTWLPVLAGAAGALGATYFNNSPYVTVDGSYQARPSGQTPSLTAASSKETNAINEWKPAQRPELSNDDFGQRQKNPRRYTEMKFDQ